ncbi:hypothetical protein D9M68_289160 [compost metagenome]
MQPLAENIEETKKHQPKSLLMHLDSLIEKNEQAHKEAIRDFRDRFTLGSTLYSENCD